MQTSLTPIATDVAALTPPGETTESAFTSEQRELARSGIPAGVARPGTGLPDAAVLRPDGSETTLEAERGGRIAVIVFYRGAWCPFCNIALRIYQNSLFPELQARGVALLAVSPQHPDGSLSMAEKQSLEFGVLSDPGNHLAQALGILTRPTDDARALQVENGLDVGAHNADGTIELPMPTTVIVGADGALAWIDVHPDYSTRTEPAQILQALDELGMAGNDTIAGAVRAHGHEEGR